MGTGDRNIRRVATSRKTRKQARCVADRIMLSVQIARFEVVNLRTMIADAARDNYHRQHLHQFKRCRHRAETKDIFTMPRVGILRQPLNVLWIVEQPIPLRRNESRVVLSKALQATSSWRGNVHPHVAMPK